MLSNTTLKNTLDGIKAIAGIDLFLFDIDGTVLCQTARPDDRIGTWARDFAMSEADSQSLSGTWLIKIKDRSAPVYVLAANGEGDTVVLRVSEKGANDKDTATCRTGIPRESCLE